jgi:hypothetical protein
MAIDTGLVVEVSPKDLHTKFLVYVDLRALCPEFKEAFEKPQTEEKRTELVRAFGGNSYLPLATATKLGLPLGEKIPWVTNCFVAPLDFSEAIQRAAIGLVLIKGDDKITIV